MAMTMLPSLLPSLRRAVAAHHHHRAPALRAAAARLLSGAPPPPPRSSSSVPALPSHASAATPEQVAAAKYRLVSGANPRSRRGNNLDRRKFPSYLGLPTDERQHAAREATEAPDGRVLRPSLVRYDTGVLQADMPFLHHRRHDHKNRPKFKNPRKRASKLYNELMMEKIAEGKASKPSVWEVPFKVGDAVELEILDDGGVDNPLNKKYDLIRGVVLGRHNRGLDTGIYLKDVIHGEHVERKVKLFSPMVRSLKVLEEGFVNRGKKKGRRVKRAKLYYLRDRPPEETRVTPIK